MKKNTDYIYKILPHEKVIFWNESFIAFLIAVIPSVFSVASISSKFLSIFVSIIFSLIVNEFYYRKSKKNQKTSS